MADDRPAMARVGRRPAMATKRAIVGRESRRLLMGEQVCVYLGKLGDVWRRADRWRASTAESAGADGAPAIDIPNDSQHPLVSQGLLCARDAGNAFGRLFASAFDAPPQCTAVCSRLARTSGVRRVDKVARRGRPLCWRRRGQASVVVAMSSGVRSEITAKKCPECRFTRSRRVVGVGGRHRGAAGAVAD